MIDKDPSNNEETEVQVQHLAPIPTKWVPLFIDNPSITTAITPLSALVDKLAT